MAESENQITDLTFDESKRLDASFLVSASWWTSALQLVWKLQKHFLLIALVFGTSNVVTAYADYTLTNSNMDFTEVDLPALTSLGAKLAIAVATGLILGLVSLSIWLEKLTAVARLAVLRRSPAEFDETRKEVSNKKGYIAAVWMVGVLFLLLPLIPASVCIAFRILANSQIMVMGEPLIQIPQSARLPMTLAEILLFSISTVYCILLTVISSALSIPSARVAKLSAVLMMNQAGRIILATLVVSLLNVLLSAPVSIYLAYLAPLEQKKDLLLIIASQLWFGLSGSFVWPLSMLVFVKMLQGNFSGSMRSDQSFSSPDYSQE